MLFVMSLTLLIHSNGIQIKIGHVNAITPLSRRTGSNVPLVNVFSIVCEFSIENNFVSA